MQAPHVGDALPRRASMASAVNSGAIGSLGGGVRETGVLLGGTRRLGGEMATSGVAFADLGIAPRRQRTAMVAATGITSSTGGRPEYDRGAAGHPLVPDLNNAGCDAG